MNKPGAFFFNFFRTLFGRREAPPPSPPPVSNTQYGSIPTQFDRNNPSLLEQLQEANRYRSFIESAARRYNIQPAVVCGIGSRESRWGLALRPPNPAGTGDFTRRNPRGDRRTSLPPDGQGYGRGLMQIDYDWHEFARTGSWYSPEDNIQYACSLLDKSRTFFRERASLDKDGELRAILAAYNSGNTATLRAIQAGLDFDANTTGKDYSRDVLNRAGWFQLHGWD